MPLQSKDLKTLATGILQECQNEGLTMGEVRELIALLDRALNKMQDEAAFTVAERLWHW